jgi:hypothetical protein
MLLQTHFSQQTRPELNMVIEFILPPRFANLQTHQPQGRLTRLFFSDFHKLLLLSRGSSPALLEDSHMFNTFFLPRRRELIRCISSEADWLVYSYLHRG